jgi:hypothetical protein
MTLTQEMLRHQAARRIRAARPDLAGRRDLSTAAELISVHEEVTAMPAATEPAVVCVVRRFDLGSLIRGNCEFATGLAEEQVSDWRRSFTRTIFLAGNPRNLLDRFTFAHISHDGAAAWTYPSTMDKSAALRRLLKLFHGPRHLPVRSVPLVEIPGRAPPDRAPVRRELYIATAGVAVTDSLVNLNHLLAEAVFDGLIGPGDQLAVRQVPRLVGVSEPFEALRVSLDHTSPDRFRAYAGLTRGER